MRLITYRLHFSSRNNKNFEWKSVGVDEGLGDVLWGAVFGHLHTFSESLSMNSFIFCMNMKRTYCIWRRHLENLRGNGAYFKVTGSRDSAAKLGKALTICSLF